MKTKEILCCLEDPGARAMFAPAADVLRARGFRCREIEVLAPDDAPALLVVGTSENPRAKAFALVHAARLRGVPTLGIVDSAACAAYRFRGLTDAPLAHVPDRLAVCDAATREAFVDLGLAPERVKVVGWPQADRALAARSRLDAEGRERVRERVLGPGCGQRLVVTFATEISAGLDPALGRRDASWTLAGRGAQGRTETVLEELLDALKMFPQRPWLLIKLHPKNADSDYDAYRAEVDAVSRGDPFEVMYASDVCVGMTSIFLFEAAVMGTPTLSATPCAAEWRWLASVELGLTQTACERESLRTRLGELLDEAAARRGLRTPARHLAGAARRLAGEAS